MTTGLRINNGTGSTGSAALEYGINSRTINNAELSKTPPDIHSIFRQAVSASAIPQELRSHSGLATRVRLVRIKQDYLDFLERQEGLTFRGKVWQDLMRKRRQYLGRFNEHDLLSGEFYSSQECWWILVDPAKKNVIYWEWETADFLKTGKG